jgi:hypothetical protein
LLLNHKKMKKILFAVLCVMAGNFVASANVAPPEKVSGYTKSNGTYVQPYYRTQSNSTKSDNYSTKGNTNPYTGKKGYN